MSSNHQNHYSIARVSHLHITKHPRIHAACMKLTGNRCIPCWEWFLCTALCQNWAMTGQSNFRIKSCPEQRSTREKHLFVRVKCFDEARQLSNLSMENKSLRLSSIVHLLWIRCRFWNHLRQKVSMNCDKFKFAHFEWHRILSKKNGNNCHLNKHGIFSGDNIKTPKSITR